MTSKIRCWWCGEDELYCAYHDREWGVQVHDDRKMFEMLILEGFQAGLNWIKGLHCLKRVCAAYSMMYLNER